MLQLRGAKLSELDLESRNQLRLLTALGPKEGPCRCRCRSLGRVSEPRKIKRCLTVCPVCPACWIEETKGRCDAGLFLVWSPCALETLQGSPRCWQRGRRAAQWTSAGIRLIPSSDFYRRRARRGPRCVAGFRACSRLCQGLLHLWGQGLQRSQSRKKERGPGRSKAAKEEVGSHTSQGLGIFRFCGLLRLRLPCLSPWSTAFVCT